MLNYAGFETIQAGATEAAMCEARGHEQPGEILIGAEFLCELLV